MRAARQQQPGIGGRERIHILGGIQRIQHGGFVQMFGQGQLHQDAVHGFVGVKRLHLATEVRPGWCRRQARHAPT